MDRNERKLMLDPDVLLDPVSLALNLIFFEQEYRPLYIPLASLWEELDSCPEFSDMGLDEMLHYISNKPREEDQLVSSDPLVQLKPKDRNIEISLSIIKIAHQLGIIRGFITEFDKYFFEDVEYSLGALGSPVFAKKLFPGYEVLKISLEGQTGFQIKAKKIICKKFSLSLEELMDIVRKDSLARTRKEYLLYNAYRRLDVELRQIYAASESGLTISTSTGKVIELVDKELRNKLLPVDPKERGIIPYLNRIKVNPMNFTVKDIFEIIKNRKILHKFGDIEIIAESIKREKEKKEYLRSLVVYLFGFVPVIGILAKIPSGFDLIKKGKALFESDEQNFLYFDIREWKLKNKKMLG